MFFPRLLSFIIDAVYKHSETWRNFSSLFAQLVDSGATYSGHTILKLTTDNLHFHSQRFIQTRARIAPSGRFEAAHESRRAASRRPLFSSDVFVVTCAFRHPELLEIPAKKSCGAPRSCSPGCKIAPARTWRALLRYRCKCKSNYKVRKTSRSPNKRRLAQKIHAQVKQKIMFKWRKVIVKIHLSPQWFVYRLVVWT